MPRGGGCEGLELELKGCVKRSFEEKWELRGVMESPSYDGAGTQGRETAGWKNKPWGGCNRKAPGREHTWGQLNPIGVGWQSGNPLILRVFFFCRWGLMWLESPLFWNSGPFFFLTAPHISLKMPLPHSNLFELFASKRTLVEGSRD